MWVGRWNTWVCEGDMSPNEFDSLQGYLEEFPYRVSVSADSIKVVDPGSGNGAMEWMMRLFRAHDGTRLVVLTETDANHESKECKLWIGQWTDAGWLDLTDIALPEFGRAHFFAPDVDAAVIEDYELVALQYVLDGNSATLRIEPVANADLACVDGRLDHAEVGEEAAEAICRAWQGYRPVAIQCTFDPATATFRRIEG